MDLEHQHLDASLDPGVIRSDPVIPPAHGLNPSAQSFQIISSQSSVPIQVIASSSSSPPPNVVSSNWQSGTDQLHCYLMNARSLNNKLPELHHLLYSSSPSLVLVSESWLSFAPNSLLDPSNLYTVLRCDRSNDVTGGGICAFIPRSYHCIQIDHSCTVVQQL